jgi:hypothetical protein
MYSEYMPYVSLGKTQKKRVPRGRVRKNAGVPPVRLDVWVDGAVSRWVLPDKEQSCAMKRLVGAITSTAQGRSVVVTDVELFGWPVHDLAQSTQRMLSECAVSLDADCRHCAWHWDHYAPHQSEQSMRRMARGRGASVHVVRAREATCIGLLAALA